LITKSHLYKKILTHLKIVKLYELDIDNYLLAPFDNLNNHISIEEIIKDQAFELGYIYLINDNNINVNFNEEIQELDSFIKYKKVILKD